MRVRVSTHVLVMEKFWKDTFNRCILDNALSSDTGIYVYTIMVAFSTTVWICSDHVTQTVTANITSLLEEDPINHRGNILNCGSSLLNIFCQFNWIGPHLTDLSCSYPNIEPNSLVCIYINIHALIICMHIMLVFL